jgi:hypothetical protein
MWHCQDCCEIVELEEVVGNPADMIGSPILLAQESTSSFDAALGEDGSITWTFYRFATNKDSLVLRWKGESNGYYSESVDFDEVEK